MRTRAAVLAVAVAATWSLRASAQLQPPPPMQAQPPSIWSQPQQPPPGWAPQQPGMAPSATQQQLNASANATSFRGFEIVYANAEAGGTYVNLGPRGISSEGGAIFGVGAGLRFLTWTFGLRARVAPLADYTLILANLEAGFHLPLGAWDPYVNIHGGYATTPLKNVPGGFPTPSGFDLGGSLGADYYFSALLSVGLDLTADALFLSASSQSTTGSALIGSLHLGLHFDL